MHDKETVQMMKRCRDEIRGLQARIDKLEPKAEAYMLVLKIIDMISSSVARPMKEDLSYTLDRRIQELEAEIRANEEAVKRELALKTGVHPDQIGNVPAVDDVGGSD